MPGFPFSSGVPPGGDILDVIDSWGDESRQKKAYAAIAEVEAEALLNMKVMPGAQELCTFLDANRVPRGLITREWEPVQPAFLFRFRVTVTWQGFGVADNPMANLCV